VTGAAPARALLLLGSNVDPVRSLEAGVRLLAERFPGAVLSPEVEGPAEGVADAPPFRNRAALVPTALAPAALRDVLRAVEAAAGRVRTADRFAPRTLDVDLVLLLDAAGAVLPDPPVHPDLLRHHYAALPCAALAGAVLLPDGRTLAAAAAALGPPPPGFRVLRA
jgi:2-amino-4-hydroxy-6-hydroxymethyldihydropteridine diphosphokinase